MSVMMPLAVVLSLSAASWAEPARGAGPMEVTRNLTTAERRLVAEVISALTDLAQHLQTDHASAATVHPWAPIHRPPADTFTLATDHDDIPAYPLRPQLTNLPPPQG